MNGTRKTFLTTLSMASGSLGLPFAAAAAEFDLRLAAEWNQNDFRIHRLTDGADAIRRDTNGRVDIHVFPNSALGGQAQSIAQVRLGAIDIVMGGDSLAGVAPVAGIFQLPFVFASANDALAAAGGPLGKYRQVALAKTNIYAFDQVWSSGFRLMMNQKKPIVGPDDMKGLKLRTTESPVNSATFKALGATPVPMTFAEVYTALQTHLVDGLDVPLSGPAQFKLYEVIKYISYTNHIWTGITMLANSELWSKIPKPTRDVIEHRMNDSAKAANAQLIKQDVSDEQTLKGYGMIFNNCNLPAFRAVIRSSGLYAQWRNEYGPEPWALLEKSVGPLA